MSFGSRFKKAREKKQLSQQELADLIDATDGTISNYEKGVAFPRWDTMRKLCNILNVDPNYLFWDDLSDRLKNKIMDQMTFDYNDEGIQLYKQLNDIGRAEIKGEIKGMLKSDKYQIAPVKKHGLPPNADDIIAEALRKKSQTAQLAAYNGNGVDDMDLPPDADDIIAAFMKKKNQEE